MSIGIAMLARNSGKDIPRALGPFVGKVDEIAILEGGQSTDDTRRQARAYANRFGIYTGPLDADGGLLDFGLARQQSFDLLTTDWALVVDTDDVWSGVDKLAEVIADAEGRQGVLFPHQSAPGATFMQPRLYRRDSGRWSSPVHELFIYHDAPEVKTLLTNVMGIRQEKDLEGRMASTWRNIRIAERYLVGAADGLKSEYPPEAHAFRLMLHLCHEYIITAQYDMALDTAQIYLKWLHLASPDDTRPDKMFQIHYMRGIANICLDQYEQAVAAAVAALSFAKYGHGWTLLAEAAYQMGAYDLTLCAADNALAAGRPIGTIPIPFANVASVPYHLKAKALAALGRKHEALTALELGLGLGGGEDMGQFKYELCTELGVIP